MDRFENQFTEMDAQTSYMEGSMGSSVASSTPQNQVDELMAKVADENGIEFNATMREGGLEGKVDSLTEQAQKENEQQGKEKEEDDLEQRLKALRPAT